MTNSKTAVRYAEALYALAREEGLEERILEDLRLVCALLHEQPDYLALLAEPSVTKQEKRGLLDEAWRAALHAYTLNFMKLLCDEGLIRIIFSCERQFRTQYYRDHGILEVRACCAAPMSPALEERLRQTLERRTGKKVLLQLSVDESLLGGVRLDMDGTELDGTVRRHLDELRRTLRDAQL